MGGYGGQGTLNDVWSSTDGLTWKMLKANNDQGFSKRWALGATVLKGIIQVAAGLDQNDVWSSSDLGKTWIQVLEHAAFGTRGGLALMAQQGMLLVIGGQSDSNFGDVYNDTWISTTDGKTWMNTTNQGET